MLEYCQSIAPTSYGLRTRELLTLFTLINTLAKLMESHTPYLGIGLGHNILYLIISLYRHK